MKSAVESPAPAHPLQILLVEDNALIQEITQRLLNEIGYNADIADTGLKALAAVQKNKYDLVLMDLGLPEIDGLEAARRIRALTETTPQPVVIAMTASAFEEDRDKCLAAGMNDYVTKPIEPAAFQEAIQLWSEKIHTGTQITPGNTGASPVPPGAPPDGTPENLQRIEQFSDGTPAGLRELVDLYLEQTANYLQQLENAIIANDKDSIRQFSHKGTGSSGICGMDTLAQILREIEFEATYRDPAAVPSLFQKARAEFARIQSFLEKQLAASPKIGS